jgi:hypothetical protein
MRAARAGLLANAALALVKGAAGVLGNSFALVADAVESHGDILGSLVVWSGLRVSAQDADPEHPYGHGKAEPIAAAAVGLMLVLAGAGIVFRAIQWMLRPHAVPAAWTLVVLVLVVVVKEGFFRRVIRLAADIGNFSSSLKKLFLKVFSFVFRKSFFDCLRCSINQIFSFFQAKTSKFFNKLHDLKFVSTWCFQDNIKIGFFFCSSSTATSRCSNNRSSSCRLNAVCFF